MQDLRYAWRQLRRNPAFAWAAILTLALGIGACTAIFSVADAVVMRPLPYPHSERLVMVWNELSRVGVRQMDLSPQDFEAFRLGSGVFEAVAAFHAQERILAGGGNAERVTAVGSTASLLEMLGVRVGAAIEGRSAWISYALFERRFGGDSAVVGRSIHLDDEVYTVAGVLPRDFEFGTGAATFDVWTALPPLKNRRTQQYRMLALLRPGVSIEAAGAFIAATAQQLNATVHPYAGPNGEDPGYGARVVSLHEQMLGDYRTSTLLLLGAVALVLAIACVNVANLLLARAAAREKEIAIRRALGASRGRLLRQWMVEGGVLTALGGVIGAGASYWGVAILRVMIPVDLPAIVRIDVNGRALLFTFVVSALACLLFSLAPMLSMLQISSALRGARRRGMSGVLVSAEVALALMLLVGSGLLLKSFTRLRHIDTGVRTDHLMTMPVALSAARYQKPAERIRFFSELRQRLAQLPGVKSVSSIDRLPVFTVGVDTTMGNPFSLDGRPWVPSSSVRQIAHTDTVGSGYFSTMGIPLLAGRDFSAADTVDAGRVAIINQTLAKRFFEGRDPLGRHILLGLPGPGAPWMTIVGVIGDVRTGALDLPPMPQFYFPDTQDAPSHMFMVLRTAAEPLALSRAAADVLRGLDPEVPAGSISSMEAHVDKTLGQPRFSTLLLMFFGVSALFLAAVGIYGVVTHATIQRTREIGIRMALGADAARVTQMVLAGGMRPVVLGMILGFAVIAGLVRFLSSVLYGVRPGDPMTLVAAAMVLAVVAVLACLGPARRASRVEPMVALRYE